MSEKKLSVKEFESTLRTEVRQIAEEQGWNIDKNQDRGFAFQYWFAQVVASAEQTFETDPEDAMLYTKDIGADLVFEEPNSRHLLICQTKYAAFKKHVDEKEVNDFFSRHKHYSDPLWIKKHASKDAISVLGDYADKIKNGWTVAYYFVSTARASDRLKELRKNCESCYCSDGLKIRCELLDFSELKNYYLRSLSLEESVPDKVTISLPKGRFFEKDDPHKTVVAVVKGNALRNLGKKYRQSLYAWNIRGYLGNRGINQAIQKTAETEPDSFFYFNNGVSAICTDYKLNDNELVVENFQIINGAQTVSTLTNSSEDSSLEVLFRLTKTESVKTEKGFNRSIIQYNNSQNIVKVSDFRSNDEIQFFLEKELSARKPKGALPKLKYKRKRGPAKKGTGRTVKLEMFGKIRYAFLNEPTKVHSAPKLLWTTVEDGGEYEKAFGVQGEIQSAWSPDTLNEAFTGLAFYWRIEEICKKLSKDNKDLRFLNRFRFHILALAGEYYRNTIFNNESPQDIIRKGELFNLHWKRFWNVARGIFVRSFIAVERDEISIFALLRSTEKWDAMKKEFNLTIATGID